MTSKEDETIDEAIDELLSDVQNTAMVTITQSHLLLHIVDMLEVFPADAPVGAVRDILKERAGV